MLRLHNSEHTGGCSPRVLRALAALTPANIACYPAYADTERRCAEYYGVTRERLVLTNGLDEGILVLAVAKLRPTGTAEYEAILPEPAFSVFRICIAVSGGTLVQVAPRADFSFALDEVLAAITPRTRLVCITTPNNPTGAMASADAVRAVAARVPADALVFVDETYGEFSRQSFVPELERHPNVVVGRSLSKAFGLAGLRLGCLLGAPHVLAPLRDVVPIYSVNVAALVGAEAALDDREHLEDYLRQVDASKALLYEACDRLGVRYWRSGANFVMLHVGEGVKELVSELARRGVQVRDESRQIGCEGCIRVTTGVVSDTRRFIEEFEQLVNVRSTRAESIPAL